VTLEALDYYLFIFHILLYLFSVDCTFALDMCKIRLTAYYTLRRVRFLCNIDRRKETSVLFN
jgi:hypothetical protein